MTNVVAVSGGFDPLHIGHLRYLMAAAALGKVQVWLTEDKWLVEKKGYCFMPYEERKAILEAYDFIWKVVPQLEDPDGSAAASMGSYKPDIFAKGGDRTKQTIPEVELRAAEELGILMVFNVGGGKAQSSTDLVKRAIKQLSSSYLRQKFEEREKHAQA